MSEITAKPTPRQLRTALEDMVVKDLLGPAGGESEELVERNVRDRYLVGVLAPRPNPHAGPSPDAPSMEDGEEETPLLPDELAEGGADEPDEGPPDLAVPVSTARQPSSFGMTFCVHGDAQKLKVSAWWGQYLREVKEDQIDERTGRPLRIWKRYPRGGTTEIPLQQGKLRPVYVDAECPEVYIQGKVRRTGSHWIVTLFLVNSQEEPSAPNPKDPTYLFQPELIAEAVDGSPIFEKKPQRRQSENLDPAMKLEEDTMAMLYRHEVEFAVGHGVSVHADLCPTPPHPSPLSPLPSPLSPLPSPLTPHSPPLSLRRSHSHPTRPLPRGTDHHAAHGRRRRSQSGFRKARRPRSRHEAAGRSRTREGSSETGAAHRGLPDMDRPRERSYC